jgi:hypothetical protein
LIRLNYITRKKAHGLEASKGEQLKNKGGHKGICKNAIQVLLIEEERNMTDLRWQDQAKIIQECMVSTEECCLKWEQEQKIPRKNYGIEDG